MHIVLEMVDTHALSIVRLILHHCKSSYGQMTAIVFHYYLNTRLFCSGLTKQLERNYTYIVNYFEITEQLETLLGVCM
jgi:hypothetical protein